jgi:hypothetical protein
MSCARSVGLSGQYDHSSAIGKGRATALHGRTKDPNDNQQTPGPGTYWRMVKTVADMALQASTTSKVPWDEEALLPPCTAA